MEKKGKKYTGKVLTGILPNDDKYYILFDK